MPINAELNLHSFNPDQITPYNIIAIAAGSNDTNVANPELTVFGIIITNAYIAAIIANALIYHLFADLKILSII